MNIRYVVAALSMIILSSCGGENGCEPYVAQSADITIYDAITGMPIACGATVSIGPWSAPYLDAENCDDGASIRPHLGAGDFELFITKPGYEEWSMEIQSVPLNRCGTITEPAVVEAFLTPNP